MIEPGVAVIERDSAIQRLMNVYFGSCKTVPAWLGMDLQPPTLPLHDVVVANDAFVGEAADAFQIVRGGPPSQFGFAGPASKAAIVVDEEASQDTIGRVQIAGVGQAKFAGEAILEHAPEALDAAFGLRRLRGDEGDCELLKSATKLSGLAAANKLFVNGPMIIVASEDAAAIAVEGDGDAEAAQEALEQAEVALGGFREEELSGQDFSRGVILHAEVGEPWLTRFHPEELATKLEAMGFSRSFI